MFELSTKSGDKCIGWRAGLAELALGHRLWDTREADMTMAEQPGAFGDELRRRRHAAKLSLPAMAHRVHYSTGYLSKIENGRKPPTIELARQCDAVLGAGGALAALVQIRSVSAPDDLAIDDDEVWTVSLGSDGCGDFLPLDRRTLLKAGAATAAMVGLGFSPNGVAAAARDRSTVTAFWSHFDHFRRLGQTSSPSVVLPALIMQTRTVWATAERAAGELRPELLTLATRYAEFAGWMSQELGNDPAAVWWTRSAVRMAAAGGDPHFASFALVRYADMAMYRHDATSTIDLASRAQANTSAPVRVRGLATQREAQGHALAGDYDSCRRALDQAASLLLDAAANDGPRPPLGSTNVHDPVAIARGWSLYDLGRPAEAAAVLDPLVADLPPTARRARTRYDARRVLAHASAGEVDHACGLTDGMLDDAELTDSATVRCDLRALGRTLVRWRTHPPVRELLPRLNRALYTPTS